MFSASLSHKLLISWGNFEGRMGGLRKRSGEMERDNDDS